LVFNGDELKQFVAKVLILNGTQADS
jgi:hypothetical protein